MRGGNPCSHMGMQMTADLEYVNKPGPDINAAPSDTTQPDGRDVAIDYLRAFIVVLVILLHAALAYAAFSVFDKARYVDSTAPVVDASRWPVLDPLVFFLDTFMMALLFLISGLFALPSLERLGSKGYFLARLKQLGVPFVAAVLILMPLAFWPSYLMAAPESQASYWVLNFTSDGWPTGPAWFLWMLLLFSGIVALVNRIAPAVLPKLRQQPTVLAVLVVTVVSFLPLSLFCPTLTGCLGGPLICSLAALAYTLPTFSWGWHSAPAGSGKR